MRIINVVASGDLHQTVDLYGLSVIGERFQFDPEKYHGGYLSLHGGKATIYRSGKYILYGMKSVESLSEIWEEFHSILSSFFDMSRVTYPVIQNIVGMTEMSAKISLTKICAVFSLEAVEYEPEVFPGLIWHLKEGTCLIFSSGKILMMGAKSVEQLRQVESQIVLRLAQL